MQVFNALQPLREHVKQWKMAGKRVALVPTMGNLHDGHISLVEEAHKHADIVVATIFVNPMQFNDPKDLENYPRTEEEDQRKLAAAGTHALFLPSVSTIYPHGIAAQTVVEVPDISDLYCGNSRPGHFRGVTTIVCKLFNLVTPDVALFGEKDFQQLFVIRRMTAELCMNIEIIGVPTKRETSGLAMSSRNNYLSDTEKQTASALFETLTWLKDKVQSGDVTFNELENTAHQKIQDAGFKPDYFHILDANSLQPASATTTNFVILGAAFLGMARLIDNLYFSR